MLNVGYVKEMPLIKILFFTIIFLSGLASLTSQASEDTAPAPIDINRPIDQPEINEIIIVHPNPEDDWLFGFHDTISDSVFGTARWFDKFFAADEVEETRPETLARIRLGYEPRARNWDVFSQRFRVRVRLPNLAEKVDLIFTDEDDDENSQQPNSSRALNQDNNSNSFNAAIRVINKDTDSRFVDTRIGISGGDLYVKARAKFKKAYKDKHAFEFEPSIFYYLDDGFGTRGFFEYEFNFAEKKQFRTNFSISTSESYKGFRWRNSYFYLRQHNRYQASALGIVVKGEENGDRGFLVDNYTLSYRYRINAYRRWMYFEIEPFVEWPEDEQYKATPGIALRVEGYFKDN